MNRKGWYVTNSNDEVVKNGVTYGECLVAINCWKFRDEQKEVQETWTIRFGA